MQEQSDVAGTLINAVNLHSVYSIIDGGSTYSVPGTVQSAAESMVIQTHGPCLKKLILEDVFVLAH